MNNLVTSIKLVGGAYQRGRYSPGWANITLADGSTRFVPEKNSNGFAAVLDYADSLGLPTADYRARINRWVETGVMPPSGIVPNKV